MCIIEPFLIIEKELSAECVPFIVVILSEAVCVDIHHGILQIVGRVKRCHDIPSEAMVLGEVNTDQSFRC